MTGESRMNTHVVSAMGNLPRGAVISIGIFDGVHVGHRTLLAQQQHIAADADAPTAIVTFFPPARTVFTGAKYLTNEQEKVAALSAFSPAAIAMVPFTTEYTNTPKEAFIAELNSIAPAAIIVGPDFRFGHNRAGGLDDLRAVCRDVVVQPLIKTGGEVISSTAIRDALQTGDIRTANGYLGRVYTATGTVVEGERRGRTIGFPTANFAIPEGKALPLGVLVVRSNIAGKAVYGIANVGPRPTFPDGAPSLEVHYLDFTGNVYGEELTVEFLHFIRAQQRFTGLEGLTAQLEQDRLAARAVITEQFT